LPTIVLPDIEKMLVEHLRTHAAILPLTGNQSRVYTEVPADAPVFPLVVLFKIGGTQQQRGWFHWARISVEAWAGRRDETPPGSKHKANELARTVQGVILATQGRIPAAAPLGVVTQANVALEPSWQPDESSKRPRYIADYEIGFHPLT